MKKIIYVWVALTSLSYWGWRLGSTTAGILFFGLVNLAASYGLVVLLEKVINLASRESRCARIRRKLDDIEAALDGDDWEVAETRSATEKLQKMDLASPERQRELDIDLRRFTRTLKHRARLEKRQAALSAKLDRLDGWGQFTTRHHPPLNP